MSHRFLYVIGQLRSGGSERQLYYLLKSIDRYRYQPAVVIWNFCESDTYVSKIRDLGVPLHPFTSVSSRTEKLQSFRRIVAQARPAVVHSYSFHTNFGAFWATRGTKAIAIGGVRSDFDWAKKETGEFLGRLSARWPRGQIFNSSAAAQSAQSAKSPFTPKRCWVVRNGVDLDSFCSRPPSVNRRATIVGVGSLFPIKRWDRLISAGRTLKQKGVDFQIRLVGDGPLRESLQEQAYRLGIADRIDLIGHTDNISNLMAEATFLVHAADKEGCPNAVMEAMASGRAVVATNVGDVPHLVEDGRTGFVVCRGDEGLLIQRIATLIMNHDLCAAMGRAGRTKAEREFGLERLAADTLAAYRSAGWEDTQA